MNKEERLNNLYKYASTVQKGSFAAYESVKSHLADFGLTPQEYMQAARKIAKIVGV